MDQSRLRARGALASLDRLSLLTSFVLIGLTLSLVLDLPTRSVDFSFLGSEASFTVSGTWLIALLLAALTSAGVDSIARTHPRIHLGNVRYLFILWILPSLIVVTATILLSLTEVRVYGLVGVLIVGALLVSVVIGEYFTIDMEDPHYNAARLGVNLAVYFVGLVLFATIYSWKVRSFYSAPLVGIAAGLLALELLRGSESDFGRTWLYGAFVGLAIGEIVWALNYWNLDGFTGGAFLLIFFYGLTGLAQQHLWGRLTKIVFVEFAMIFVGAIALLFWLRPH
jgi:hypothetical protein